MQPWLAEIYSSHKRGLYALALSITHRPDLAEDAVQDAFSKMIRLEAAPSQDKVSYTFGSVRNAAFDLRQKQKQIGAAGRGFEEGQVQALDLVQASATSDPTQKIQRDEEKEKVQAALATLPPEDREVIIMRLWSNLSFEQIGLACKEPLGTIASRYYRALALLRTKLAELSPQKEMRHAS